MLELTNVTVACIDCAQPALALAALGQTVERVRFADVLFASDDDPEAAGLTYVRCPTARTSGERLDVLLSLVARRVATSHVLLVQWDAFVVNPEAWMPGFLDYDCVTAAGGTTGTPVVDGIALLSLPLLRALAGRPAGALDSASFGGGDDGTDGFRRAPPAVSERFAFAERPPVGRPFAFQGAFNLWMYLARPQLEALLSMATPAALASDAMPALARHLAVLGRMEEARAVVAAVLRARPDHALARALSVRLTPSPVQKRAPPRAPTTAPPSAPTSPPAPLAMGAPPRAVGRNDPCPCGSGRKYKQCHGQLGAGTAGGGTPQAGTTADAGLPSPITGDAPPETIVPDASIPGTLAVWLSSGRDALARDDAGTAREHLERVVAHAPDQAEALGLLGVIASRDRRFDDAERLLARALERSPDAAELHSNRGALFHARARFADAAASYQRAVALDPDHVAAYNNLGLARQELGDVDRAVAAFREAVQRAPSFADAHWNLGLALLLDGHYPEGFAEHEWRLSATPHRAWWERRRRYPRWNGEALDGKRVLVLAEQGMGDMIHFVRYATLLASRGATVVVEAAPALRGLLSSVPGVAEIAPLGGPYPSCDVQIPIMSLPFAFGTRVDTIPAFERYVRPSEERLAWARALLGTRRQPRIGFAWAGNPQHVRDRFRSLPLATLTPLLARGDCEWIALQKGDAAQELAALPPSVSVRDCGGQPQTFADLAALVDALDGIVTVDTALVHVAGALGKPAIVLVDAANDWRWMRAGERSAWYPSVRIARQVARGDWGAAIAAAQRQLGESRVR